MSQRQQVAPTGCCNWISSPSKTMQDADNERTVTVALLWGETCSLMAPIAVMTPAHLCLRGNEAGLRQLSPGTP